MRLRSSEKQIQVHDHKRSRYISKHVLYAYVLREKELNVHVFLVKTVELKKKKKNRKTV